MRSPAISPTRPSAQQAIETVRTSFGGLDILVNNAGIGAMGLFESAGPERVRRVMEVNFFALVEMTRLALPLLKDGKPADRGQRRFDPRAIAAFPQQRVRGQQVRRPGLQRVDPRRMRPPGDRRAGGQPGHDRDRVLRPRDRPQQPPRPGRSTSRSPRRRVARATVRAIRRGRSRDHALSLGQGALSG